MTTFSFTSTSIPYFLYFFTALLPVSFCFVSALFLSFFFMIYPRTLLCYQCITKGLCPLRFTTSPLSRVRSATTHNQPPPTPGWTCLSWYALFYDRYPPRSGKISSIAFPHRYISQKDRHFLSRVLALFFPLLLELVFFLYFTHLQCMHIFHCISFPHYFLSLHFYFSSRIWLVSSFAFSHQFTVHFPLQRWIVSFPLHRETDLNSFSISSSTMT